MTARFDRLETMISQMVDGQEALSGTVQELRTGQQELRSSVQELRGTVEYLKSGHANLERLITDVKESLETEMHHGFSVLRETLDDMSVRLDRQAGLLRAGR